MSNVYQCELWHDCIPTTHEQSGELVEFAGERMVRISHGAIVPIGRATWHETKSAAKREAADKVDSMIVKLHGLAARLRAEADAEDAKGGAA